MRPNIKKVSGKAAGGLKRLVKDVSHEIVEIPKQAPGQLLGDQKQSGASQGVSPIAEAMQQKSDYSHLQKPSATKLRIPSELEKDLQRRAEIAKQQQAMMDMQQQTQVSTQERLAPVAAPTSKRKRGLFGASKRKQSQGTKELGKNTMSG